MTLPCPDNTPSRKQGISAKDERLHRLQGTFLIEEACQILQKHDIFPTACVVFHRFFHQVPLNEADVWSVSLAATLLAAKSQEVALPVRNVILAFAHLYRKRALLMLPDDHEQKLLVEQHPAVATLPGTCKRGLVEKEKILRAVPPMSQLGPVWKEWHDAIVQAESRVLRQLGFTLYWIPDSHAHVFIPPFVQSLQLPCAENAEFTATAWCYCSMSYRLDLCVRFAPEVIACAAIHVAALQLKYQLPAITADRGSWWCLFCGSGHDQDVSDIANAILGLEDETNLDVLLASKAYLKSRMVGGSCFSDPDSFLWNIMAERIFASCT